jgi:hypothetical protein
MGGVVVVSPVFLQYSSWGDTMSFVLRPYRRFPVVCDVLYEHWFRVGQGIVWNLSTAGWRLSGTLPLQCGDVCSLRVVLPTRKGLSVAAGIVRWVRGEDFGIETLVMDGKAQARLGAYIRERTKDL